MADVDLMDLFDKEFVNPEEVSSPRSSGIQDYKHSRQGFSRVTSVNSSEGKRSVEESKPRGEVSSSGDIDERLVWIGAIFVFFGVFAFLLGYWLGNIKEKEITEVHKTKQSLLAEKVQEQKTEIGLKQDALPVRQAQEMVQNVSPESQASSLEKEIPVVPSLVEKTAAPIKSSSESRARAVKPQSVSSSVVKSVASSSASSKPTTSETGAFTIQVSAHTSLEKAQNIENQLRQLGFSPYIVETTINETTYYRVRVGSYTSKTEAESSLSRLKQHHLGKDAYVLSLK